MLETLTPTPIVTLKNKIEFVVTKWLILSPRKAMTSFMDDPLQIDQTNNDNKNQSV